MSPYRIRFSNSSETLVIDSLKGLCAINPQLALDEQNNVVYIRSQDREKVALICGGGAGHEPAHAGYVGKGMLTAAVSGNIFASPNSSQILKAIDLVNNDKGGVWKTDSLNKPSYCLDCRTIIIVKNYTGDVLNFGLAKEQFSALHPEKSHSLKFVIVGDDVAVDREQGKIVGRRGLAGTTLVYKIAGALANRGGDVDDVYTLASWIAGRLATIGVSLGHTHVPGSKAPEINVPSSEIEIGMGIHNESGYRRLSPIPQLSELIPQLLDLIMSTSDPARSFIPFKGQDNVVLMVNNLGGVSELELGAIAAQVISDLDTRGVVVSRILCGTYMTSLDMPGFSITLFLLPSKDDAGGPSTDLVLSLLDDQPEVPGWKWNARDPPIHDLGSHINNKIVTNKIPLGGVKFANREDVRWRIKKVANALIRAEPEITRMDTIAGDGDCGLTLKAGAEALLRKIDSGGIPTDDVILIMIYISKTAEEAMGGTSGALYSIFFSALAQGIQECANDGEMTPERWSQALVTARNKLYTYTRARPPSRTLVDPLAAFIHAYNSQGSYPISVKAAADAAEMTKDLDAKAGRSAYLDDAELKMKKIPDPGAWGVKVILENL